MTTPLSVVMPVFNEAAHLPATIDALVASLENSTFSAELVLVDDGSTDGSAGVVRTSLRDRLPLRVLQQPNRGRFEARRAGLEAASADHVLLLDARVRLETDALAYVADRMSNGASVWTGHVDIETDRNPFALFWALLASLGWREYFANPRETSFGVDDFDHFPKGTGCFIAPRGLLLAAIDAFESRYPDLRHANDDAPLLRSIATRERIHVSPGFKGVYRARPNVRGFVSHSFHRGLVFLDGHGRRESRFFPLVVAFYPLSGLVALAVARKPARFPLVALALSTVAAAVGLRARRSREDVQALALVAPVYALAHGAGMWWGLLMLAGSPPRAGARSAWRPPPTAPSS